MLLIRCAAEHQVAGKQSSGNLQGAPSCRSWRCRDPCPAPDNPCSVSFTQVPSPQFPGDRSAGSVPRSGRRVQNAFTPNTYLPPYNRTSHRVRCHCLELRPLPKLYHLRFSPYTPGHALGDCTCSSCLCPTADLCYLGPRTSRSLGASFAPRNPARLLAPHAIVTSSSRAQHLDVVSRHRLLLASVCHHAPIRTTVAPVYHPPQLDLPLPKYLARPRTAPSLLGSLASLTLSMASSPITVIA